MRCFFMSSTTSGEDLRFSKQKIEYMWSFINKLWNCANLINANSTGKLTKKMP
jgi:valyl-tRNA synthetase